MRGKDSRNEPIAMSRLILRFRGAGPSPVVDIERMRALPNTTVIDDSSDRMLLVEAPEAELKALIDKMQDWVMAPEQIIQLPNPRPKAKRGVKHES